VVTITNGFDGEIVNTNVDLDTKFTITHIGLMNSDRNSTILWEVLAQICAENCDFKNDFRLKLIGKLAVNVIAEIEKFGLSNNVEIIDYVSHNEVIKYQQKSQILLLLVNNVPSAKGIVTGKIFEYLMAKRPILAIAPTNGDLAAIIQETNAGAVVDFDDKALLKNTILDFYTTFKTSNLNVNSKNIEQFHRIQLTKKVAEIINQITE
jgi:glycosyltransferase involved in cell wall biosynthesis